MNESKYIVFKRDEFDQSFGIGRVPAAKEVEDVAAFRLQDRFSAPAIQAYFDAVSNVLEVLEEFGMPDDNLTIEDLTILRDWAFEMAQRARTYKDKKIPEEASVRSVINVFRG